MLLDANNKLTKLACNLAQGTDSEEARLNDLALLSGANKNICKVKRSLDDISKTAESLMDIVNKKSATTPSLDDVKALRQGLVKIKELSQGDGSRSYINYLITIGNYGRKYGLITTHIPNNDSEFYVEGGNSRRVIVDTSVKDGVLVTGDNLSLKVPDVIANNYSEMALLLSNIIWERDKK